MSVNKYFRIVALAMSFVLISACEEEDRNPLQIHTLEENIAPYVRIVINTPVIDASQLESTVFSGTVDDPNDNVVSWEVQVRKIRGNDTIPYADLATINSFPSEFNVTGNDLATALDIPLSEIQPGDVVEFNAISTGTDGTVLTFPQLGPDLFGQPEQRQAYFLSVFVACPFNSSEVAGTYDVVTHTFDAFFGPQGNTREVIAGPGPNQFTVLGGAVPLDGADDLIITVNPQTGQVSFGGDPSDIHFNTFGPGVYGNVTGLTFTCVGYINLVITSPGFIANTLTLRKQ